jgi:ubiquinone/menaquinone biosynthesis C-methylase UbiE
MAALDNHKADEYSKNANFVYSDQNTAPIFQLLNAQPGERIMDLGCGTGELTVRLKELVGEAGSVWGIDSSTDMVR